MEQKIKFAIIGLVGLLLVSFIIILQVSNSKQALERQLDGLNSENASLRKQADDLFQQKRRFDDQIGSLKDEINKTSQEKEDLQKKYDLVERAKEDLIGQIKSLRGKVSAPQPQPASLALPQTDDAYWSEILRAKTDLEFQVENVRAELRNLQINNEQLQREKSAWELDLASLKGDKKDLSRQIEYNQKIIDSVTQELVREKNDKAQIQDSLKTVKNDNSVLRRQIKSINNRKIILERKLAGLQEKNSNLEGKLSQMNISLENKMSEIGNVKKQIVAAEKNAVELAPIVVRPQADRNSGSLDFNGKIVAINRDNNFVVVDLGENSGIKIGDKLQVYRDNKAIASIEVIQARKTIAACDIKKEPVAIIVGDAVK